MPAKSFTIELQQAQKTGTRFETRARRIAAAVARVRGGEPHR